MRTQDELIDPDLNYYFAYNIEPTEKDSKRIQTALEKKKNTFTGGSGTLRRLKDLYADAVQTMTNPPSRQQEFNRAKKIKLDAAENTLMSIANGGGTIYKSILKKMADKSGKWFTADEVEGLLPRSARVVDDTKGNLDFSTYEDIEKDRKRADKDDLYDVLGKPQSSSLSILTAAIKDTYSSISGKTDTKSTAMNNLCGYAKIVFKDNNTKKYYDAYLALKDIFDQLIERRDLGVTEMQKPEFANFLGQVKNELRTTDSAYAEALLREGLLRYRITVVGGNTGPSEAEIRAKVEAEVRAKAEADAKRKADETAQAKAAMEKVARAEAERAKKAAPPPMPGGGSAPKPPPMPTGGGSWGSSAPPPKPKAPPPMPGGGSAPKPPPMPTGGGWGSTGSGTSSGASTAATIERLNKSGEEKRMKGQYDAAISDFTEVLRLDPNNAYALRGRGEAYRMKGQYDVAIKDFDASLRIEPNSTFALSSRGEAYRAKKQYDAAIRDFTEALRIDPNDAYSLRCRGECYRMKSQYDAALRDFDASLRIEPNSAFALGSRGATYNSLGKKAQAIQDLEQALRLDPNNQFARGVLKDIRGY